MMALNFHMSSEVWVADLIEMKFRSTEAECRAKFRRVEKLKSPKYGTSEL